MKISQGQYLPLGVTKSGNTFNFAIGAMGASSCILYLYKKGEKVAAETIKMDSTNRIGGIFCCKIEDNLQGYEYQYELDGKKVIDPYGHTLVGGKVQRNVIAQEEYNWGQDRCCNFKWNASIAYGIHPKGFTMDKSSKVKNPGTFLGIQEKIPYLKKLGITLVKCMPLYELVQTTKKASYWGFTEGHYFSPRMEYSATKDPVTEFKDLVKAFHKADIAFFMDIHFTAETNKTLMLDCLRHWHINYHVDGFHIYGPNIPISIIETDPVLADVEFIRGYDEDFLQSGRRCLKGEAGQIEHFAYQMRKNASQSGVLNCITTHNGFTLYDLFSYEYKHNEENQENNMDGTDFNLSSNCGIEGETTKRNILDLRKLQMKNALAILFLAQGTPFLLGGDEFANSQKGNNNPYCQDNPIAWLNWKSGKREKELAAFIKGLIFLRKQNPMLCESKEVALLDYDRTGNPALSYHGDEAWMGDFGYKSRHLGMMYCLKMKTFMYVAYNFGEEVYSFALPKLPGKLKWHIVLDTQKEEHAGVFLEEQSILLEEQKTMPTPGKSIVVLVSK